MLTSEPAIKPTTAAAAESYTGKFTTRVLRMFYPTDLYVRRRQYQLYVHVQFFCVSILQCIHKDFAHYLT